MDYLTPIIIGVVIGVLVGGVNMLLWSRIARKQAEDEKNRTSMYCLLLEGNNANLTLGKATARAVQRIPDAKCNGDMSRALEYVQEVEHRQEQLLREQVAARM